jgi:hypothetical protein
MNKDDSASETPAKRRNIFNVEVLAALIILSTATWFVFPYIVPFLMTPEKCGEVACITAPSESAAMTQMQGCRDAAIKLYMEGRSAEGDKKIDAGLKVGVSSKSSPAEIDMYACLLQERANEHHSQYLDGKGSNNGIKEQLASLTILDKYLHGDNAPTLFKLSLLGVMYAEDGDEANADKIWSRAIPMADRMKVVPQRASGYTYAFMARAKAVQHKYKEAFAALRTAEKLPFASENEPEQQFYKGCQFEFRKDELANVQTLFRQRKFAELDAMFDRLTKSRAVTPTGRYKAELMSLNDSLDKDIDYTNHFQILDSWSKSNPKSVLARLAKADAYVSYAWLARGSGYANTVSESGWQLMRERLEKSKQILDNDPTLKAKSPSTFATYQRIARGQQTDRNDYFKLVSECDRLWTESIQADSDAAYFLLPRWYGVNETEWVEYMEHVSDKFGGRRGDVRYASIAADLERYNFCQNLFEECPRLSWPRIDRGFRQILKEYPNSGCTISAYVKLAKQAHKEDQIADAII